MNRALRWGNTCGKEVGLDKVHLSVSAPGKVTGAGCAAGPHLKGTSFLDVPLVAWPRVSHGAGWSQWLSVQEHIELL